jgi:type II secretory pathway component PulK
MKNLIQRNKLNNERGVALILAMMVMVALSLLTVNSFEMLSGSISISRNHKDDLQALYVAEAGIEDAIIQLRYDRNWGVGFLDGKDFNGNKYIVEIENPSGSQDIVKITSTGKVGNFSRVLEAQAKIIGTEEFSPLEYSVAVLYWKEKEIP